MRPRARRGRGLSRWWSLPDPRCWGALGGPRGRPDFTRSFLLLQPCYLRDWEMQVHFKIHGQGKKNLNGDGFAIWYTKDRMQPGEGSGAGAVPAGDGDCAVPPPRGAASPALRAASGALCGIAALWGLRAAFPSRWQAQKGVTAVRDAWHWGCGGSLGGWSLPSAFGTCLPRSRGMQGGVSGSTGLQLVRTGLGRKLKAGPAQGRGFNLSL